MRIGCLPAGRCTRELERDRLVFRRVDVLLEQRGLIDRSTYRASGAARGHPRAAGR